MPMLHLHSFRFHTGSIKSEVSQGGAVDGFQFRFHTGSIKSERPLSITQEILKVSIPYWFD